MEVAARSHNGRRRLVGGVLATGLLAAAAVLGLSAGGGAAPSGGWALTVYYTPVESFHHGAPRAVYGCPTIECSGGHDYLGSYPSDFVQAAAAEGTGRITSGLHAGMYLNWSGDVGYWLDTATRDAQGLPLRPFVSAAADPSVPFGTAFSVVSCGVDDTSGDAVDPAACNRLQSAPWVVTDRFTNPRVGQHLDLYIGEEDRPNFLATSPLVVSLKNAVVSIGSTPVSTTLPRSTTTTTPGPTTTRVAGLPGPPPMLVAAPLGPSRGVRLVWAEPRTTGGPSLVGYRVERATGGGGFTVLATTPVVTTYVDATATSGTQYRYRVSAVNGAGPGSPSPVAQITAR